jgi:hypothetical protein
MDEPLGRSPIARSEKEMRLASEAGPGIGGGSKLAQNDVQ